MTSLHGVPTSTATGEHQPTISSLNASSARSPMLDPALLSISSPQPVLSSPSPTIQVMTSLHGIPASTTTGEHQPTINSSNLSSALGVATPGTHPNGMPSNCSGAISETTVTSNKSTWATCNPGWPAMQPRQPLSTAEKECRNAQVASRQISTAQRKDRNALLNEAVQSLADEFEVKVHVIAATHNITEEKVRKLLGGYKYYWNPRSTQLANAIIHDKAHEVNEGKPHFVVLQLHTHTSQVALVGRSSLSSRFES